MLTAELLPATKITAGVAEFDLSAPISNLIFIRFLFDEFRGPRRSISQNRQSLGKNLKLSDRKWVSGIKCQLGNAHNWGFNYCPFPFSFFFSSSYSYSFYSFSDLEKRFPIVVNRNFAWPILYGNFYFKFKELISFFEPPFYTECDLEKYFSKFVSRRTRELGFAIS